MTKKHFQNPGGLIAVWFLALFLFPLNSIGQETVIKGTVTDQDGNPLKNVKITFSDPSRGMKFTVESDKKGNFMKVGIPPTVYQITAELDGYFPMRSQARIRFGFTENIAITLRKVPPKIEDNRTLSQGIEFFRQGQYDQAIVAFQKVVDQFPNNVEGYYNLGLSYLRKGELDQAIEALEMAVEVYPEGLESYLALGECYFLRGESEKALKTFSKAVEIQPENPKVHYNLGIVYYKMDNGEKALKSFDKTLELNPGFSSAHYQAALTAVKLGSYKLAIQHFEAFLKLEPEAPEAEQIKVMVEELKKRIS